MVKTTTNMLPYSRQEFQRRRFKMWKFMMYEGWGTPSIIYLLLIKKITRVISFSTKKLLHTVEFLKLVLYRTKIGHFWNEWHCDQPWVTNNDFLPDQCIISILIVLAHWNTSQQIEMYLHFRAYYNYFKPTSFCSYHILW
jgi:hypothetical protein